MNRDVEKFVMISSKYSVTWAYSELSGRSKTELFTKIVFC